MTTPWDARILRARALASRSVAARDVLDFYAALAERQHRMFVAAVAGPTPAAVPFADAVALDRAAAEVPAFLRWLGGDAPAPVPLKAAARAAAADALAWRQRLDAAVRHHTVSFAAPWWTDEPEPFIIRAIVQPFAEAVAAGRRDDRGLALHHGDGAAGRCPVCGDAPRVGVLREDGQSARRTLLCGRCHTEWPFPRLTCPGCGETQFEALPVFRADEFPHIRVEACDGCTRYLKTMDLTVDGLAVSPADDVASLPLDLWAAERGYGTMAP